MSKAEALIGKLCHAREQVLAKSDMNTSTIGLQRSSLQRSSLQRPGSRRTGWSSAFRRIVLLASCFLISLSAQANVQGVARVVDGDTINIGGQAIRLHGIDAPESGQQCNARNGRPYTCGVASQKYLRSLAGSNVVCTGTTVDAYDRLIGICRSNGVELNRQMVLAGHAVAYKKYSTDYVTEENQASREQRGMWAGSFEMPWNFRAKRWNTANAQVPVSGCPIKGNINRQGEKIYHAPWSNSYSRTKINTARLERWFCSEREALAAGWRAPRQ